MTQQLIVAGFHRSGTSLTAQLLHRAGVDLGKDTLPKHSSNPHGHFEDRDIVQLHDRILADNDLTWQVDGHSLPEVEEAHRQKLLEIIESRDSEQDLWGFKDPRVCLFLETWKSLMPESRILMVYRDFSESTYSLRRRAAERVIRGEGSHYYQMRLWEQTDLALKMWLLHNKLLVNFARKYPDDVMAVSFSMLRNGFPLVKSLNKYWGLSLKEVPTSEVFDPNVAAESVGKQMVSEEHLISDTLQTWEALEKLGRRTLKLAGVSEDSKEAVHRPAEGALYLPEDAYARTMERDFLSIERQFYVERQERLERAQQETDARLQESEREKNRLASQLESLRRSPDSEGRERKLEDAEKDLTLLIRKASKSKLAPLIRLKKEFRELEKKYL